VPDIFAHLDTTKGASIHIISSKRVKQTHPIFDYLIF
jgi:hypothetical protein